MFYNSSTQTRQALKRPPKFSIIIPCYKVEKYIRACLDSVLAQKCDSWEAICTDDGSPDGTGAILDEYAARDARIKVIHQQNAGLSAARNAALDVASGDWLIYLDSDDLLPFDALTIYERADHACPKADIVRGCRYDFRDGDEVSIPAASGAIRIIDLSNRISDFCTTGYFQQHAFRRATFGDLRYYGASWCEERPYGAKCVTRIRLAVDIDGYTYAFRSRMGSITHTHMTLGQFKGYLQATRDMAKTYYESGRRVDRRVVRGVILSWMERQVYFLCEHLKPEEKSVAWVYWFGSLKNLGCGLPVPVWFRFVRYVCEHSRSRFLALCLCYMPHWLKSHGLHRKSF